jgi:hypothetical protein
VRRGEVLAQLQKGVEVTNIKTGQILSVEGYGFMFGRINTGEIKCFNIDASLSGE